jgi:cytochrome c
LKLPPELRRETASGLKCAGFYQVGFKMKLRVAACAAFAVAMFAGAVHANEKLAQSSGCMTCHSVDKKIIGPSFNEVAAKYRNDKKAEADLFKKVKSGGKGVWGETPMPPNAHVKDEDINTLVHWILTLK